MLNFTGAASFWFSIKHPLAVCLFLFGKKEYIQKKIIIKSFKYIFKRNFNRGEVKEALLEIKNNDFIPMNSDGNTETEKLGGIELHSTFGNWMYCAVRVLKPEVFIETGVAHGKSSWLILNALNKNKKGKLFSIDLPDKDTNANFNIKNVNRAPGWLVPNELRERWRLIFGSSSEHLPILLREQKKVDFFMHDSEHTYANMSFEFKTVLPFINQKGFILSDDIEKNDAFNDFVKTNKLQKIVFNKGGCAFKEK